MKKEMKKIVRAAALVLALMLLVGVLSGCMENTGEGSSTTAPPADDGGDVRPVDSDTVNGASSSEPAGTESGEPETSASEEFTLSDQEIEELEDAGLRFEKGKIHFGKQTDTHDFGAYYGTYNGYAILLESGMLQALWKIEVAGFVFHGNTSFEIYACKGDEIFTLKEAYEKGLLTVDDIAAIAERHGGPTSSIHEIK